MVRTIVRAFKKHDHDDYLLVVNDVGRVVLCDNFKALDDEEWKGLSLRVTMERSTIEFEYALPLNDAYMPDADEWAPVLYTSEVWDRMCTFFHTKRVCQWCFPGRHVSSEDMEQHVQSMKI